MSAEIDYSKIGMRIRAARKECKLTQEEVALACGCTSNHLSAVETGSHKPSLDLIIRLATVLNSSVDYFLMDTSHANQQYLISSRIAPKLVDCSAHELQYIERVIDELMIYKSELRHIRFHDLRHSCASLLLANGVPMKQIQEWLGHSDFSTTANIYAHLDYQSKLASADAIAGGLRDALSIFE